MPCPRNIKRRNDGKKSLKNFSICSGHEKLVLDRTRLFLRRISTLVWEFRIDDPLTFGSGPLKYRAGMSEDMVEEVYRANMMCILQEIVNEGQNADANMMWKDELKSLGTEHPRASQEEDYMQQLKSSKYWPDRTGEFGSLEYLCNGIEVEAILHGPAVKDGEEHNPERKAFDQFVRNELLMNPDYAIRMRTLDSIWMDLLHKAFGRVETIVEGFVDDDAEDAQQEETSENRLPEGVHMFFH
ncbi:hypothetical protein BCR34DRAFT_617565 [Clohesyomyces aquaticus]|uniref:Uncharacterized protein n=1 Tax=Clohesyomyces aquaticus TaxID=1231657 RepID=A0A1Y1Z1N4_9PLEO|nr:hypothetical protein BCR34DRAFT_617565 [Clohesyomyces aquaticus]